MKQQNKLLGLAAMLLLGTALNTPAMADFDALAVIQKDKKVTVMEEINITKIFQFDVDVLPAVDATAEALTIANQRLQDVSIDAIREIDNSSDLQNSINGNRGITAYNQDSGNASNQGNTGSFAIVNDGDVFANAEVSAEQINGIEVIPVILSEDPLLILYTSPDGSKVNTLFSAVVEKRSRMVNSINGNTGITHVNQNSGDLNNQLNAMAVAVGLGDSVNGFALAEADLGQETALATVIEFNASREATMQNVGSNNHGIVGVNQSAGVMGNQANVAAASAVLIGQ